MRRTWVVLTVVFAFLVCLLTACGESNSGGGSGGGAGGEFGTGLELGKTISTAPVGATVGPWYRWNNSNCTFEVAKHHPASYRATLRAISGGPDQLGYMHYGNTDPFGVANSKSIEATAEKVGMPLNVYNLKFPSRTEPLADARASVVKGDNGVIQANLDPTALPAFFDILEGEGCIPSLQLYIPIEDHPAIGNNWPDVGMAIADYAAEEAKRRKWSPEETALVQCTDPSSGPTVDIMFKALPEKLAEDEFEIPDQNIYDLVCKTEENQSGLRQVTDWYTSHPEFEHVIMAAVDTLRLPNMIRAAESQGVPRDSYISGAGADEELSRDLLREGKQDVSISFLAERFGEYAVPLMEDVMAGNPVPKFVGTKLIPLTHDNVDKYYPE